ncbi:UNC-like C-terminal-domain-containing protein [Dichotomopilus funicola]|uniref:UNC-like C-terminal-domain-containing protein n=1 Tax=Dichotomopilus funicola TaxID=1934379 RepID=A0AAN6V3M5_9PEZI|nr:UNC-like C-terminal-domain-containing protein [Dichotomopilus funicola]
MRAPENWPKPLVSALSILAFHALAAYGSRTSSETAVTDVCESRTINYITHTLPQQCLRTSWTSPTPAVNEGADVTAVTATTDDSSNQTASGATTAAPGTVTVTETPESAQENTTAPEQDGQEDLAASSFMSFEEWKEMMLRKSGQDPANIEAQKRRERRERERGPAANAGDTDSFGEEGEISLDFDALTEKVSEIASSADKTAPKTEETKQEQPIFYDDGKTQYYRSKDAGKTCKERFSYASFDAGATVLKTSPKAQNAKAVLAENKDSYMLLECRSKNKFIIVELSDDILVDTVVLANFEFFSSMIRKFKVSVSDRYPVKLDKWVDLGTFEARNSRDIQAFLIEHPQIYTKYIRIEFLTHWGNEFYCPVSLLRVHGTRMLDTWKEPNHDDEQEQIDRPAQDPVTETPKVQEEQVVDDNPPVAQEPEPVPHVHIETGLTLWRPLGELSYGTCKSRSPTTARTTHTVASSDRLAKRASTPSESPVPPPPAASPADEGPRSGGSPPAESGSSGTPASQKQPAGDTPSGAPSAPPQASDNGMANNSTQKPSDARRDSAESASASTPAATATPRDKTATTSSAAASPTVQESFFKTVTKRLQLLESNTSMSLQYIEEQSRFLQDVLLKIERKQITRVDSFLDNLNKTVLSELRNVRTQYDQIWQSTVLALETQRDQSQREVVALTSRLNILADEVVFQKRMAILQSVLLLSCLVLVIFSRGGLAALDSASFPTFPPASATAGYRRYGYARSDSISGMSPPNASRPQYPNGGPSPINEVNSDLSLNTGNADHSLAASALPRHLYPTTTSFKDKSLPLTPPSEYSRESTPATTTHHHNLNQSSPDPTRNEQDHGRERGHDDTGTPSRAQRGQGLQRNRTTYSGGVQERIPEEADEDVEEEDPAEEERERGAQGHGQNQDKPPVLRSRSAVLPSSASGGLRKPLPALPEDPN